MSNKGNPSGRRNGRPDPKPRPSPAATTTTATSFVVNVSASTSASASRTSSTTSSNTTSTTNTTTSSGLQTLPAAPCNTPSRSGSLANSTLEQLVARLTLSPQPDNLVHLRCLAAHYEAEMQRLEAMFCPGFGLGRTASSGSMVSGSSVSGGAGGGSGRASLDLLANVQQGDAGAVNANAQASVVGGAGTLNGTTSGGGGGTISGRSSEERPPLITIGVGRWTRQVFEAERARLRSIKAKIEELLRLAGEGGCDGGGGGPLGWRNAVAFKRGMEGLLGMLSGSV